MYQLEWHGGGNLTQSFGKLGAVLRRESERGGGAVPWIK